MNKRQMKKLLKKSAQPITVQQAWDVIAKELSTRRAACYFVDSDGYGSRWKLYDVYGYSLKEGGNYGR